VTQRRPAPRQQQDNGDDEGPAGLTGLDWAVIVASTLALGVLLAWLVQGQPTIPGLIKLNPVSRETDAA